MTISRDEYEQTRKRVEEVTRERDRAAGALAELKKQLKEEFGVTSEKQARALQEKLDKESADLERQYRQAEKELEEKWGDKLDGS